MDLPWKAGKTAGYLEVPAAGLLVAVVAVWLVLWVLLLFLLAILFR
jgi:hypothetical protein